jgi:hypothetical protein
MVRSRWRQGLAMFRTSPSLLVIFVRSYQMVIGDRSGPGTVCRCDAMKYNVRAKLCGIIHGIKWINAYGYGQTTCKAVLSNRSTPTTEDIDCMACIATGVIL